MPPTATEKSCAQAVRAALKTPSRRPNGTHSPCRFSVGVRSVCRCSGRSRHSTTHRTASWPAGHPVTCRQPVVQPLLTVTPFQKATRPRISSAAALGSG
jgi:hypothetical protein